MIERSTGHGRRSRLLAIVGLLAISGSLLAATPAQAAPARGCDKANLSIPKLLECVTVQGVRTHLDAFQGIASTFGDTRASGTPGYDASAAYVADVARRAGLTVTTQRFDFPFFRELAPGTLAQISPTPVTYPATEVFTGTYSGSGDVVATVRAVDVQLPPAPAPGSTSGCEAADFAGFTPGSIALIQRGTCTFGVKATNAQAAGAAAVIVFNEGQPGRTDPFGGTLGAPGITIPVVFTSFATGADLADPAGTTARVATSTESAIRTTTNVFAETTRATYRNDVLMVGAHLDSVVAGPGINDNGSGSAAILEVARLIAKTKYDQTVRFAWWGAEELGLLGSQYYIDNLPQAERDRINAYLNFDMVGSPNFARFIYDGDDSDGEGAPAGPPGSDAIEDVFQTYYSEQGLTYEGTDFSGRSDYGPFIAAGVDIPSGGLFTGAEGIKTPEQAARYGGTAGLAYDENYHEIGDTIGNINNEVLGQNADAIAFAVAILACQRNLTPNPEAVDYPSAAQGGGGLHDEAHEHPAS